jgi:hypothetical protein
MVYEIVEIACLNRYKRKGFTEQPMYGDTDSLLSREWQANLLIQAGWLYKLNSRLTYEITYNKAHIFFPSRIELQVSAGSIAKQLDWILNNAT